MLGGLGLFHLVLLSLLLVEDGDLDGALVLVFHLLESVIDTTLGVLVRSDPVSFDTREVVRMNTSQEAQLTLAQTQLDAAVGDVGTGDEAHFFSPFRNIGSQKDLPRNSTVGLIRIAGVEVVGHVLHQVSTDQQDAILVVIGAVDTTDSTSDGLWLTVLHAVHGFENGRDGCLLELSVSLSHAFTLVYPSTQPDQTRIYPGIGLSLFSYASRHTLICGMMFM